jgi:hypothetical protein
MRKGTLPAVLALAAAALTGCGGGGELRIEVDESSRLDVGDGAAWVERDRRVTRVDPDGKLTQGPIPAALGAWDVEGAALWVATDRGIVRHDARTLRPLGAVANAFGDAGEVLARGPVVWARSAGTVQRLDARDGRALGGKVELKGGVVNDWVADGRAVYAVSSRPANLSSDHWITRIDARTGEAVTRPIQPRDGVFYAQLAVGAGRVWVAQSREDYEVGRRYAQRSGTVTRLDPRTLRPAGPPTPVGPSPFAMEIVGGTAWITDLDGGLARVDARTGRHAAPTASFGRSPPSLEVGRDVVYAAQGEGTLQILDPRTARARDEREVDEHLGTMRIHGGTLWLLNEPTQDPEVDDEPPWTLTRLDP